MDDELATSFLEGDTRPVLANYIPFARLGHGGMAEVLLAMGRGPMGLNKLAVIKLLRNVNDAASLDMFLDEARLSARLSHPNIVSTYDVGEVNGQHFLAMEYLEGQSLDTLLSKTVSRGKLLDEGVAAFIAAQALRGLHYAHELLDYDGTSLQVVHRDVSPHNLFLTYRGEVKLLDFGIAKAALNFTHTDTGVFKGKVRYMAPEQIGEKTIDRRADVFAVGVVLWEMLAGRALYSARADVASIVTRMTGGDPPLLRTLRGDVSRELEAIVAKALRRDRDSRYSSAEEMRADLERAFRGRQEGIDATLARMLEEMFAETRDAARARIKAFLARLTVTEASRPGSARPSSGGLAQAPEYLPPLFGDAPLISRSASGLTRASNASSLASPVFSASQITVPPAQRSSFLVWAGAGAATLAAIAVATLRATPAPPPAAAAPHVMSPAPAAVLPTTAPVHVETSPAGALIEWNGKPLARTPAELDLPPGPQGLKISYEGYEPAEVMVHVTPGQPMARAIVLRPKIAPLPAVAAPRAHASPRATPRLPTPPASQPVAQPTATATAKIRVVDDDIPTASAEAARHAKIRVVDDGTQ